MTTTFYTSPSKGSGLRGSELERCYQGPRVDGVRNGIGTYTYPNKFFEYTGSYVNGKKHGQGKLVMRDGGWYEGSFDNDEIQGEGVRMFSDGRIYAGTFVMGEMHGEGSLTTAGGDKYTGSFATNAFEGEGLLCRANGEQYRGGFHRHRFHGTGCLSAPDGRSYQGEWSRGLRDGQGVAVSADGDRYEGAFADDAFHGEGRLEMACGTTIAGNWRNGVEEAAPSHLEVDCPRKADPKKGLLPLEVTAGAVLCEAEMTVAVRRAAEAGAEEGGEGAGALAENETNRPIRLTLHADDTGEADLEQVGPSIATCLALDPTAEPEATDDDAAVTPAPLQDEVVVRAHAGRAVVSGLQIGAADDPDSATDDQQLVVPPGRYMLLFQSHDVRPCALPLVVLPSGKAGKR